MREDILTFYKQTSIYTDLGLYSDFAKKLPDDINLLGQLQRKQIIHPYDIRKFRKNKINDYYYGDMTKIPEIGLVYENDLYPTAIAIISELLRRDSSYSFERKMEDKLHLCCREQAILLAAILKAKGYACRVRSGFSNYIKNEVNMDHWITEYYNEKERRWILVDADFHFPDLPFDFNVDDIPRDKFIFGAESYLGIRTNKLDPNKYIYASDPPTIGLKAALRALFYDFHSLMNNEIIFLHAPKYIVDRDFILSETELEELDNLAKLLLNPDKNFDTLQKIWNNTPKYRILSGGMCG